MPVFSAPAKPFHTSPNNADTLFPGPQFKVGNRQIKLEDLYLVNNHPQQKGIRQGRTFVYYQDTSLAGLIKTWLQEKDLEPRRGLMSILKELVPKCNTFRFRSRLHELDEGDTVFSRNLHGDDDPAGDVVQVWVGDGSVQRY
ncbi:hypothetical protein B0H14DRAFT_3140901 [Mycena olivaceomarginata]|nr:hypothetical protein B0H14DRAFT_3140901 [Mycena olivaceomarginata]